MFGLSRPREPAYQPELDRIAWLFQAGQLTPAQLEQECNGDADRMAAIVRFSPPPTLVWDEKAGQPRVRTVWTRRYH